ncbi:MAG TPA: type IV pilus assembly protein PilM [Candidatus Pristimantibacillus sp.]|jgi:type IV pilus assembly protein PilM|nr:type IV pilus assembly protein PilM [Candidatus Pristimantibacillus sp.]
MGLLTGVSSFFGLDIGTTAIRVVQLRGGGAVKGLLRYAYVPIDSKLVLSDSKTDQQRLVQIVKELVAQAGLSTRNVAVGIPSQRVFTAVVDFDRLPPNELAKAIRYQADSLIPTPLEKSKMDWAIIGDSPKDKTKVEVLLTSVENNFIEQRLDMLESIGLDVIAFEPDNLALTRALVAGDAPQAQMVLDMGSRNTDLVVTLGAAPRLTRSIPTGAEAIVRAAAQNLNIDDKQARQFVFKFGLSRDKLEGRIYDAVSGTVDILTGEIDKSIKFFQSRYAEFPVTRIIVTGGASALPEFPLYLANKFGIEVEIGNAWRNVSFSPERQNELLAVSNHFGVAAGLAERME